MKLNLIKSSKKGFSLVEMLVVIAVIGVLTAIAIPMIGRINDQAKIAKDNRNAQAVVAMFNAAKAAGLDDTALNESGANAKLALLGPGTTFTDPSTKTVMQFALDMSEEEMDAALEKVIFTQGAASTKRDTNGNATK